jgi:mRNA interferase MazF
MVSRGDVWLVLSGDGEPQPCVVLSPPEIHDYLSLVTVAPLSRDGKAAAYRVPLDAAEARGVVHLEQIRTVEKRLLTRQAGTIDGKTLTAALKTLREMFAE